MGDLNINDFEISKKLDDIIDNAIDEGYEKRGVCKKKNYKKKIVMVATLAILAFPLLGGNNSVLANIKLIFFDIGEYLKSDSNFEEYGTVVNKAITKNGITIQLNEVILDRGDLIVGITAKSENKLAENETIDSTMYADIYINGKSISAGGSGSSKNIDGYTIQDVFSYNVGEDIKENEELSVKLVYRKAQVGHKKVVGPWVFEFKANGGELATNTSKEEINQSFTLESGQKITFREYSNNAVGAKIFYDVENTADDEFYALELRGNDDLGNKIEFSTSFENEKGGVMKEKLTRVSEKAKTLTLSLYGAAYPKESGRMNNEYKKIGEEFTINLEK